MRSALAALAMLGMSSALRAAEYELVAEQSNIHFSVPVMAVSKVTGKFMEFDVELNAGDKPDLSGAKASAWIDIASVDTGSDSWDTKLRAPAWFDAAKHPRIQFQSTRVRRVGDRWEADGKLTMHGVTKDITLPFEFKGRFDGPNPDEHIGIHATLKFDRRDYDMAWAANAEAKAVGHTVTVEIALLAKRVAGHVAKPTARTAASPPPSKRGTPARTSTARSPAKP
jgi:polyisoprenoid-binding protein YceI